MLHKYRPEIFVFCLALIVRLAGILFLVHRFGGDFYTEAGTIDTHSYLSMGKSLAEGHGFRFFGETSALRTPIYPLFLAGFFVLRLPMWQLPAYFIHADGTSRGFPL